MGCFVRPESRAEALMEGARVARQRGYRGGLHGEELHRLHEHGTLKHAETVRRNTG